MDPPRPRPEGQVNIFGPNRLGSRFGSWVIGYFRIRATLYHRAQLTFAGSNIMTSLHFQFVGDTAQLVELTSDLEFVC